MPKPENTCPECDEYKKEEYELCYDCNQKELEKNGNLCVCGNYKNAEYSECYECNQNS